MVRHISDQSVATSAVGFIRRPPGLDLPAAWHSQEEGLASPFAVPLASMMESTSDSRVETNAPVETSIASEKLKSFLEATSDDQYTLRLAQQAQWNLAVARVAQQVWYAQQAQSCLQQESGSHATNLAQTYHPLRTLADPGNSNTTSAMQKQSLAQCSEGAPKRPPGVWNHASRATSCSSGSSTRASSNEDLSSLRSHKLQLDVPRDGFFGCGGKRVCWPVDARKLTSNDMQIVSPAFELYPSSEFKLLIKSAATRRGQRKRAGFKDANGRGSIEPIREFACLLYCVSLEIILYLLNTMTSRAVALMLAVLCFSALSANAAHSRGFLASYDSAPPSLSDEEPETKDPDDVKGWNSFLEASWHSAHGKADGTGGMDERLDDVARRVAEDSEDVYAIDTHSGFGRMAAQDAALEAANRD